MATESKVEKPKEEKPADLKDMSKEEQAEMMRDMDPPEGYAKAPIAAETEGDEEEAPKPAEAAKPKEEKKSEEKPVEEKKPEEQDPFLKLETELNKPEGKEDLSTFTSKEKAYFYQMRRDRKTRQKAEQERDQALFALSKAKKSEEKPAAADPLEFLKDRDPNDFLTVEEVRNIFKPREAAKPAEVKPEEKLEGKNESANELQIRYLKMCEKEGRATHEDFDVVMELTPELLEGSSDSLKELADRTRAGENPALVMYELIKNHKDFEIHKPAAETRVKARAAAKETPKPKEEKPAAPVKSAEQLQKEAEAKRAQEKLEQNNERPKTTAHASSREGKPAGELTMEEYLSMSDLEFAKLPKNVREKALKQFG